MPKCIIDNRVFLTGLDELYRKAMKGHEGAELLLCARRVAAQLQIVPGKVPIEGYYGESPELAEYFQLIRALQEVEQSREGKVAALPEFQRLRAVLTSPLFGPSAPSDRLFPPGRDPLSQALLDTRPTWTIPTLISAAFGVAMASDDFSLVGLAALTRDAVLLAALRESVVLHAEWVTFGREREPEFEWRVDEGLSKRAGRFIATFNELFGDHLPAAHPAHSAAYWKAYHGAQILGRCVRLGEDLSQPPLHYHWAICLGPEQQLAVHEFWHREVWTTERYREALPEDGRPRGW